MLICVLYTNTNGFDRIDTIQEDSKNKFKQMN